MFFLLSSFTYAILLDEFNNGLSADNLTIIDNSTDIRYFSIPKYTRINDASINITPIQNKIDFYDSFNRSDSPNVGNDWNEHEEDVCTVSIVNESLELLKTSASTCKSSIHRTIGFPEQYNQINISFLLNYSYYGGSENNRLRVCMYCNDSYNTFDGLTIEFLNKLSQVRVYFNSTSEFLNHSVTIGRYITYPINISYNSTRLRVEINNTLLEYNITIKDINITENNIQIINNADTTSLSRSLIRNLNITREYVPKNLKVQVGEQDSIYEYNSSEFFFKETKINFTDALRNTLPSCSCSNCTSVDNSCTLPIIFFSDYSGMLEADNINILYNLSFNFTLINEYNGTAFDLTNISFARVTLDENNTIYDLKALGNHSNYTINTNGDVKLRFEFGYYGGSIVTRYIDTSTLADNTMRICVNHEDITHYEQIFVSAREREVRMTSQYANCLVTSDFTRFAYEENNVLRAYTTDRPYDIETEIDGTVTHIAGFDGALSSFINLDTLEFQKRQYNLFIGKDDLSIKRVNDTTTVELYYINRNEDNVAINLVITNLNNSNIVYNSSSFTNPNEFVVFFDYGTTQYDNFTLFRAVINRRDTSDNSYSITRYFTTQASSGILRPEFAFAVSLILMMFGLTLVVPRLAFSWFGIVIELASIIILSQSIFTFYVKFLMAMEFVILIYTIIILTKQTYPTIAG